MIKPESVRSPRGAKPVMKAFFEKLDTIALDQQVAVAKAAFSMVRDEMKARAEKLKIASASAKAKAKAAKPVKAVAARSVAETKPAPKAKANVKAKPVASRKVAKTAAPRRAKAAAAEPVVA